MILPGWMFDGWLPGQLQLGGVSPSQSCMLQLSRDPLRAFSQCSLGWACPSSAAMGWHTGRSHSPQHGLSWILAAQEAPDLALNVSPLSRVDMVQCPLARAFLHTYIALLPTWRPESDRLNWGNEMGLIRPNE